jgi:hypothetical protein
MGHTTSRKRRDILVRAPAAALGVGALIRHGTAPVSAQVINPESTQVAQIYELQAGFHKANRRYVPGRGPCVKLVLDGSSGK